MKEYVDVITGVEVKRVPHPGSRGYHYFQQDMVYDPVDPVESVVQEIVAPITHICGPDYPGGGVFLAVTEEVEKYIGLPFRACHDRVRLNETLVSSYRERLRSLKKAALCTRIKWLFTGVQE